MDRTYRITLGELDLGQLLDGLATRADAWEKTAHYLRYGRLPDDVPFLVEECSNPNEAAAIACHYRSIIATVEEQKEAQRRKSPKVFTVICEWHAGINASDNWQTVVVVLRNNFDAKDAANEACLFLIWDRQGLAQPLLVIDGAPKLTAPNEVCFDADYYDDTITFARGMIISCHDFD